MHESAPPIFPSLPAVAASPPTARHGDLQFCDAIIRVHRKAGAHCERELAGLRELELWALDMLRRPD